MGVTVGVDSHKSSLAIAVLDDLGRPIGVREFVNDSRGHDAAVKWMAQHGTKLVVGIEGSGNYGAALARRLLEAGEDVREVPVFLSHRERKRSPSRGKSDAHDAVAIARVVARGERLSSPHRTPTFEDLKLLSDHRDQLVRARTQLINRTHKNLVIAHPGYEGLVPKLKSNKNLRDTLKMLRGDHSVRAELIRDRIGEIRRLNEKIAAVEKRMATKGHGIRNQPHAAAWHPVHRPCQDPRRDRRPRAATFQRLVRDDERHRSCGGIFGQDQTPPVEPRRQPPAQLRAAHDGDCALPWGPGHEDLCCEAPE